MHASKRIDDALCMGCFLSVSDENRSKVQKERSSSFSIFFPRLYKNIVVVVRQLCRQRLQISRALLAVGGLSGGHHLEERERESRRKRNACCIHPTMNITIHSAYASRRSRTTWRKILPSGSNRPSRRAQDIGMIKTTRNDDFPS